MNEERTEQTGLALSAADVLVVSGNREHARADRKCLRTLLKQEPLLLRSGVEAARIAAGGSLRLVICDDRLEDMSGLEFVKLLRLHPEHQDTPLIMVSVDNTRQAVLDALEAGCSGYLLRPYSLAAFGRKVAAALRGELPGARQEGQLPGLAAFTLALEGYARQSEPEEDPVEELLQKAVVHLRNKEFTPAQALFTQVLDSVPDQATALHGLARCQLALGHPDKARRSLQASAEHYLLQGKYARAYAVHEELRRRHPAARDPLASSLEGMLRRGDSRGAADLLLKAQKAARLPEDVVQQLARVCHFTDDPMHTVHRLCSALEAEGGAAPAAALRSKLLEFVPRREERLPAARFELMPERPEQAEPLGPLGGLKSLLAVARHTVQTYRRNSAPSRA